MAAKRRRSPVMGEAFDTRTMDDEDVIRAFVSELEYYRPRGFRALAARGNGMADAIERADLHVAEGLDDWKTEVAELLTVWARKIDRHDFITFGPFSGSTQVGYWIDVPAAQDEADIRLPAGDAVPRGFSGMAIFVNDHGNVDAQMFSRGRRTRELFAVV